MIPDHVVTLCVVVLVAYVILRWGEIIFLGWTLFYFWTEQWTAAGLAFGFFCFLTFVKRMVMGHMRWSGQYNGKWI